MILVHDIPDDGHAGGDEADVREPLLQHDRGQVRVLVWVCRQLDPLHRHGVPFGLNHSDLALVLDLDGVVGAHLDVGILSNVPALQPQHPGGRVEVDVLHLKSRVKGDHGWHLASGCLFLCTWAGIRIMMSSWHTDSK